MMSKLVRSLLATIALVAIAAGLSGCITSNDESSNESPVAWGNHDGSFHSGALSDSFNQGR